MFCRHQWVEVQRSVEPGALQRGTGFESENMCARESRLIVHGYTLIEQHCEKCGKVRIKQHIGAM